MRAGSSRLVPALELPTDPGRLSVESSPPSMIVPGLIMSPQRQREEICGSRVGLGGVERPS